MKMETLALHFAPVVRDYVARELAPLRDELARLKAENDQLRLAVAERPQRGEKGETGEPGKDGACGQNGADGKDGRDGKDGVGIQRTLIDRDGCLVVTYTDGRVDNVGPVVGRDGKDGAPGDKGERGEPGENANLDAIKALIETKDAQAIDIDAIRELIQPPQRGEKGDRGDKGEKGDQGDAGAPGLSAFEIAVRNGFDGSEREWLASLRGPAGDKGEDGRPGAPGKDGADGKDGKAGRDGKDGAGIDSAYIDQSGILHLRFGDKTEKALGNVVGDVGPRGEPGKDGADGKDGKAGRDGKDGLGFDDFRVEFDGERTIGFVFERGDDRRVKEIRLPIIIGRGVYQTGQTYEKGDAVTYQGGIWIARTDTQEKPGVNDDWSLSVKRGRDGKHGKDGEKGEKGEQGRPGRDLTQMDARGNKW